MTRVFSKIELYERQKRLPKFSFVSVSSVLFYRLLYLLKMPWALEFVYGFILHNNSSSYAIFYMVLFTNFLPSNIYLVRPNQKVCRTFHKSIFILKERLYCIQSYLRRWNWRNGNEVILWKRNLLLYFPFTS